MYREINNTKRTASYHKGFITIMCDDGWEVILDCRISATQVEAETFFARGWELCDPNAGLKAKGLVWNGYLYARPETKLEAA